MLLLEFPHPCEAINWMELLLNLCWLLLMGPALYCWMHRRDHSASTRYLITLGCLLALLFPIISATDDLHVMRQEMEDSVPGKKSLEQGSAEKHAVQHFSSPLAHVVSVVVFQRCDFSCGNVHEVVASPLQPQSGRENTSRAPPILFL